MMTILQVEPAVLGYPERVFGQEAAGRKEKKDVTRVRAFFIKFTKCQTILVFHQLDSIALIWNNLIVYIQVVFTEILQHSHRIQFNHGCNFQMMRAKLNHYY